MTLTSESSHFFLLFCWHSSNITAFSSLFLALPSPGEQSVYLFCENQNEGESNINLPLRISLHEELPTKTAPSLTPPSHHKTRRTVQKAPLATSFTGSPLAVLWQNFPQYIPRSPSRYPLVNHAPAFPPALSSPNATSVHDGPLFPPPHPSTDFNLNTATLRPPGIGRLPITMKCPHGSLLMV